MDRLLLHAIGIVRLLINLIWLINYHAKQLHISFYLSIFNIVVDSSSLSFVFLNHPPVRTFVHKGSTTLFKICFYLYVEIMLLSER